MARRNDHLTGTEQAARILTAMEMGPVSAAFLANLLGLSLTSISNYLRPLRHSRCKLVRIADWRDGGGQRPHTPLYGLGSGPDEIAPCRRNKNPDQYDTDKRQRERIADETARYLALAGSRKQEWYSGLGI